MSRDATDVSACTFCFSILCFVLIRFICAINLGVSLALYTSKQVSSFVIACSASDHPQEREYISYFCYGFTASVSIIAACGATYSHSSRFLILPLWFWDLIRLAFILSCIAPGHDYSRLSQDETVRGYLYVVMLLVCIVVEMYCFSQSQFYSEYMNTTLVAGSVTEYSSTTSPMAYDHRTIVSEECEVQNSDSRSNSRLPSRSHDTAPPPYSSLVDSAPPPYSSLESSLPSTLRATTISTCVHSRPVGAAFPPEDPPPPYEYQECSENLPSSS